ncbi:DUF6197 family protein [Methylocella silvestris]
MEKKIIVEILLEARSLLQRSGWNQFCIARDETGNVVDANSGSACRYCLSGALCKAWRMLDAAREEYYFQYFERRFSAVLRKQYGYDRTLTQWNDHVATSCEEVLTLIDLVIIDVAGEDAAAIPSFLQRRPKSKEISA